ncbi:MarR family winged helix-turn-helix transcriptional regulator [Couchioplanes caeruleus]|uniref:MarR family winged helix-turn-helix transcriptional regulator n=1 Tax=Couchioplanes caeruleus TaxID=56438 RepID=UPI0020BE2A05|nr:MarR family winged helix-turn-helix transcriptional regulator [Couchioplanes caeruleus]UQU65667.1 MarR family winged helix-turn-helix transcriptional regulator [Couchioplanes caeruleus]
MSATPAPPPLSSEEEAVMRALGRLMLVLPRLLDADLEREQRMSLSEYQVLRHLSESRHGIMRMSELAAACDMSLSGMTRLAGKLESQGHLQRIRCESDGRGSNAVLTDAGLNRLREAWPDHLASVRRHIFDHLGDLDLPTVARALTAMTGHDDCPSAPAGCDG